MARNAQQKTKQILVSIIVALLTTSCLNAQSADKLSLSPVQEKIRALVLKGDGFYMNLRNGERESIESLVRKGDRSALFDAALLNLEQQNYLGLFKDFRKYFEATGDLTRIYFYTWVSFVERDDVEQYRYEVASYRQREQFTSDEQNYISQIWDEKTGAGEPAMLFLRIPKVPAKTIAEMRDRIKKVGGGINLDEVKAFRDQLDYETASYVARMLTIQQEFNLAYEVLLPFLDRLKSANTWERNSVLPTLFYSGHYRQFIEFYTYRGPSWNLLDEMLVTSLWRTGQQTTSLQRLEEMISASSLRTPTNRVPGSTNYRPAFFNLLFFYYFGGLFEEINREGKAAEIESDFLSQYRAFPDDDKRHFWGHGQ